MILTQAENMSDSGNSTAISAQGHLGVCCKLEHKGEVLFVLFLVLHPSQTVFHENLDGKLRFRFKEFSFSFSCNYLLLVLYMHHHKNAIHSRNVIKRDFKMLGQVLRESEP